MKKDVTMEMTAREFVDWFAQEFESGLGGKPDHVVCMSGKKIYFDNMTDEEAEFVANQFMLMLVPAEGNA